MLDFSDIVKARENISPYFTQPPLIRAFALEKYLGIRNRIFVKCENFNLTKSFKIRGALNFVLTNFEAIKQKGVVTRSSGNFAQSLSYVSRLLKIQADIVMPADAPAVKIASTREWGGNVIVYGKNHMESEEKVSEIASLKGSLVGSPFNDYSVMAGGGTAALEVANQLPALKYFICPIGGGGLMSGCSLTMKKLSSEINVIGVEPENACDYLLSRKFGKRMSMEGAQAESKFTICDGLKAPMVGDKTFEILNRNVDQVFSVDDHLTEEAQKIALKQLNLLIEPSSAIGIGLLLIKKEMFADNLGDIAIMITGGNVEAVERN